MPERIFIDRPLPPGFDELFGPDWEVVGPDESELPTCRAAIAGASLWPAERIAKGEMLEVISRSGIGFDTVDLDAAAAAGVVVCNTPDAPSNPRDCDGNSWHPAALAPSLSRRSAGNSPSFSHTSQTYRGAPRTGSSKRTLTRKLNADTSD